MLPGAEAIVVNLRFLLGFPSKTSGRNSAHKNQKGAGELLRLQAPSPERMGLQREEIRQESLAHPPQWSRSQYEAEESSRACPLLPQAMTALRRFR